MNLDRFQWILIGALLLAGCSETTTDTEYVERAQSHLDAGQLHAAAVELKNALQRNPKNATARRLLGIIQLKIGNAADAEKELQRANELGVADESILPLLAQAFLQQKKYDELAQIAPERLSPGPGKATLLAAQGSGRLAQNQLQEAEQLINTAITMAPESAYANVAKASVLSEQGKKGAARQTLQQVLATTKNYAPAWALLGELQRENKELEAAKESFSKAIENSPGNNLSYLFSRAMIHIQLGEYAEAQKDVEQLIKLNPRHPDINYAQGLIHLHNNRLQEAKAAFELALKGNRAHFPAYYLGYVNLRLGNIEQAENYAAQAFLALPRSIEIRKLLATIKLAKREPAKAEELIQPVVAAREDDVTALNILAIARLAQQKIDQAQPLLEKALALQPDSAVAETRLGAVLLAQGKQDAGIEHLQRAIEKDPKLAQPYLLLIRFHAQREEMAQAMQVAESYRNHNPGQPAPWNLIGALQLDSNKPDAARRAFREALKLAPGDVTANSTLAALAIENKQYDEARKYYQDILAHHKNHLDTLLRLSLLDARENKKATMLKHLQQASSAHPKSAKPQVTLARYYLIDGQPNKVQPLMVSLDAAQKRDPAVLEVLAYAQLAQKQYDEARYTLEKLIEARPQSAHLRFLLAMAYGGLKDAPNMEAALRKVLELDPTHLLAKLALARLDLLQGNTDEAQRLVQQLERQLPDNPDVLNLKAELVNRKGNRETAEKLLERVFQKAPNTRTMLSVARQKWALGDPQASLEIQQRWLEQHPDDLTATLSLATAYTLLGEQEKAIALYEKVVQKDAENAVALNDLAWTLREKDPARALEYAEKASSLAPKSAAILDTLAMVQLSNRQYEKAKRSIERVLARAPKHPSFRYHQAVIAEATGDKEKAIQILDALLREKVDFPERKEAEALLARLRN